MTQVPVVVYRALLGIAICLFLLHPIKSFAVAQEAPQKIQRLMESLHQRGQFNGSIVVAINGEVIYRNGFGESDFSSHQKFMPETQSCVASVFKTFTAMAVMILEAEGKLSYDDPISKYFPELAARGTAIQIRHLLTHTSGIPDVGDLGIDRPDLTTREILQALSKPDALISGPGAKYRYSNTGYMLLSEVVTKVSGQPHQRFLTEKILQPLEMNNTHIYDNPPRGQKQTANSYSQFGKRSGYVSGMYSTVDDLLKWDQALYANDLVSQTALAAAFTAAKVEEGTSSYGFGWNIAEKDDDKFIWHTGNTAGYRAFIGRRLKERISVIILTNKGNSRRMEINEAIWNILEDKPFTLPKIPVCEKLYEVASRQGIRAALEMYDSLKAADDGSYDFGEQELNSLGYELLFGDKKTEDAIRVFTMNTIQYPNSSNAFDSLGEAHLSEGNNAMAISSYQKAIELDASNLNAQNMLKKLK